MITSACATAPPPHSFYWSKAANAADPDIDPGLAHGDFAPLYRWLRTNVHSQGSTDALLEPATGAPLGTAAVKAHLQARYLA